MALARWAGRSLSGQEPLLPLRRGRAPLPLRRERAPLPLRRERALRCREEKLLYVSLYQATNSGYRGAARARGDVPHRGQAPVPEGCACRPPHLVLTLAAVGHRMGEPARSE